MSDSQTLVKSETSLRTTSDREPPAKYQYIDRATRRGINLYSTVSSLRDGTGRPRNMALSRIRRKRRMRRGQD
jgi:hypothetical protein